MTTAAPAKQGQRRFISHRNAKKSVPGVLCPCWVGEDGGECFSFLSQSPDQGQIDGIDARPEHVSVVHILKRPDAEVVRWRSRK
jgi:hypothetical protein